MGSVGGDGGPVPSRRRPGPTGRYPAGVRLPALASALAVVLAPLAVAGCGGGGIDKQNRPEVVSFFPADNAVLTGWLNAVRVTYDERVRVLNETACVVEVNGDTIEAKVVPDPTDDHAILIVTEGGRWVPGFRHRVVVQEGAVVNDDDHYMEEERSMHVTLGPRPNVFVGVAGGAIHELSPADGSAVSTTAPLAGHVPAVLQGSDDEVFVWLEKVGAGDDLLAWFTPGAATTTTVPLAGESGERVALGLAISVDARTLYATTVDRGTNRMRVHRIDTATRAEMLPSLELATDVSASLLLARRPAVDPVRNRLYVAQDDGAGGGTLSVVDLETFTEVDVRSGAGTSAVLAEGAGDLTFGIETDRIWMTLADEPFAGLLVIGPEEFGTFDAREQEFTQAPVSSMLTPDERYFLQGLETYTDLEGIVRSDTDEIGEGIARDVIDDVGGTPMGSSTVSALVADPGLTTVLAFAIGGGSTILCIYEWQDDNVTQVDLDAMTDGVQGVDLATSAPGDVVTATFLRGVTRP